MAYLVSILTVLFGISYWIYRTAKSESVGFKALIAWISLAAMDVVVLAVWVVWTFIHTGPS